MAHKPYTVTDFENAILKYFPKGDYWEDKESNINSLIASQAGIAKDIEENFIALHNDTNPKTTENFIDTWESAYNIENDPSKSLGDRRDFLILTIGIIFNEYILQKIVNILYPLKYNITDLGNDSFQSVETLFLDLETL